MEFTKSTGTMAEFSGKKCLLDCDDIDKVMFYGFLKNSYMFKGNNAFTSLEFKRERHLLEPQGSSLVHEDAIFSPKNLFFLN